MERCCNDCPFDKMCDIQNSCEALHDVGYRKQSDILKEIIDVIELRMAQSKEQRKGVSSELWTGIYEGKEYAYRDVKEIIEAKMKGGE